MFILQLVIFFFCISICIKNHFLSVIEFTNSSDLNKTKSNINIFNKKTLDKIVELANSSEVIKESEPNILRHLKFEKWMAERYLVAEIKYWREKTF